MTVIVYNVKQEKIYWYLPLHTPLPFSVWYLPDAQLVHRLRAVVEAMSPGKHSWHNSNAVRSE